MIEKGDHVLIAGLGMEFALTMSLGFFGGRWLDVKFATTPWLMLLCCALAFALAMYILIKSARAAAANKAARAQEDKK
ncbi:MAG: AtpZ/AtpI family protein [Elusimicrobiota bacterium]|jgi:F0F1-type ATP synthase assembly protein I|nr:AtpZ/AtpI family protein [Elusimicrobiota bacterium]